MTDRYSDGPHGTTCTGCGACCVVIQLPLSQDEARRDPNMPKTVRSWIVDDLTPIPWKRAKERAPWLPAPSEGLPVHQGQMLARYPSYYTCRHYDPDTRLCGNHADRCDVCRGYPYYGRDALPGSLHLPPTCSFRADRGETPDPWQPVNFLASRRDNPTV